MTSAAEFIRKQGSKPAKDISTEGKKAGLVISEAYVYNVRCVDRKRKPLRGKAKARPPAASSSLGKLSKDEVAWLNMSFKMGTTRMTQLNQFYQGVITSLLV